MRFIHGLQVISTLLPLLLSTTSAAPTLKESISTLARRERVPDDAADPDKVLDWLINDSEIDLEDKLVFYSGDEGLRMTIAFTDHNEEEGYYYFATVFDAGFKKAFGGLGELDSDIVKACSEALGRAASGQTRVFRDVDGRSHQRSFALCSLN